ncbi:TRAP transporter substrate-binding protein [Marinomonas primoryensis]|uniref:TRAP-type C4-dicarboxylate transport system periplasmic protein DctP n=1 Tax=Marinomonas primoryensis TaxID=178399 RepID=A0A859CZC5_9GAMM|nr:TRAP transporter substrate-binding protein [Marinomonas primoryensis]QKK81874.1 TRAP-type C4-dicarboxylate transport system periplasmic protein DctP [Marinomonas primoryensis]
MDMKKIILIGLISILTLSFAVSASADTLVLRYNQWFPSQHWSQKDGLHKYFDEIETVTEGRVRVQPSAKPIVPPTKNYQAVANGIVDLAWGPHGYTPGAFPLSEMVEFPFSVHDAGASSVAYQRTFDKFFKPKGMHDDVVTLAVHVTSGGNLHMKNKPIRKIEDFQNAKIRVQTSVVSEAIKSIGAIPISGSLNELREFLSRGIVDGTSLSDELLTGFKVDSYINYVTQIPGGLYSNSAFVVLNKKKWNQISPTDQEAIMKISGEKLAYRMGSLWHKNDLIARKLLQDKLGENYKVADESLITGLESAFFKGRLDWLEKAEAMGVDITSANVYYEEQTNLLMQAQ